MDGDWDTPAPTAFEQLDTFEALRDRLVRGRPWQETPFFKRTVAAIESGTPKWGCASEEAFLKRLTTEVEPLYDEIRTHGYKTQVDLGSEDSPEVQVGIRRDGRFIFIDGKHRLSIARLLELPQIPVQVVARHTQWEEFKEELREEAKAGLRGRIYQTIDHPDLADIPAHKGWDRVSILEGALEDYDPTGKRLLDIGCQWAFMCQQMEKLGFQCQGIESNARNVYFARKIGIATESKFEVWHGNLIDFQEPKADVVLALNIFHHLLKTEERYAGLIAFLQRLSAEIILFEPHLPERAFRQMEGAYRNYEPQEFAEFVAEHAGMRTVEYLGAADDERPLYKLSA